MTIDGLKIPIMWTRQESSQNTGLSQDCIRNLCLRNEIKYVRVGEKKSKFLINAESLINWMNGGNEDGCTSEK